MFSRNSIPILPSMKFNRIHVWFIAARKAIIPIQHAISWNQRIGRRGKTINRKPTRPLNFLLNHRISPPPPSFSPQCRHNNRLIWHCSKMSRFLCPSSRESDYYISSFSHRNCSPRFAPTISRRYAIKLDTKEILNFHVNVFHPKTFHPAIQLFLPTTELLFSVDKKRRENI